MKKNLLLLFALLCTITFFGSCSDDDKDGGEAPETPPTIEDIVAEYSGDKLALTGEGIATSSNSKVSLIKESDNTLTIKLVNVISGKDEFSIPKATFEAQTKSAYVSAISGTASDVLSGLSVAVTGKVDEGKLTASVNVSDLQGDAADVAGIGLLYSVFQGDMVISVAGAAAPAIAQKVYISAPENGESSSIKLEIRDFAFAEFTLGDIALDNISVAKWGVVDGVDVYGFNTKNQVLTLEGVGEVAIDAKGTIVGNTMNLVLAVDAKETGLKVGVTFEGNNTVKYTFEKWNSVTSGKYTYYVPEGLATSNQAAVTLQTMGYASVFPITKEDDNTAKIVTLDTKGASMLGFVIPAVTAGTLFTGEFALNTSNPLLSTKFGIPYVRKPANFKFTYKYTPGETFYETKVTGSGFSTKVEKVLVEDEKDECSINAYLYEVDNMDETLDGSNLNTSDKVIMKATFFDNVGVSSYTDKTIPFTETGNGTYDPTKLYKLAIVCSSSAQGAVYRGAPGSTLWIKYLEVSE